MHVALISLERWDAVWRRNQHFASELVAQGIVDRLTFVEPPSLHRRTGALPSAPQGVDVVSPHLRLPKRAGGLREVARRLPAVVGADVLWVNEPTFGVHCLRPRVPAVYDVTDDWRSFDFTGRVRRRLLRAEARLARAATTVVCSVELRDRWQSRYGVSAAVITNGIDGRAWLRAKPQSVTGASPHVGYIGTLHERRLDVELLLDVAALPQVGTLHLVGPDALSATFRDRLEGQPKIVLQGPVPASQVPGWALAMDVLISPHVVSDFTLSLDAIKSYEYLASGRPVVATATSGFQLLAAPTLDVCPRDRFAGSVLSALTRPPADQAPRTPVPTWEEQAKRFGAELLAAAGSRLP